MKKTHNITISMREYERLVRVDAALSTIFSAASYNLSYTVEAVKAALEAQEDAAAAARERNTWNA